MVDCSYIQWCLNFDGLSPASLINPHLSLEIIPIVSYRYFKNMLKSKCVFRSSNGERLAYANEILDDILDSAEKPLSVIWVLV